MDVVGLTCVICHTTYPADFAGYVCPDHGAEGILDVGYDYERIAARTSPDDLAANPDRTMWRYRFVMPIGETTPVPPLTVGGTPMYDVPGMARTLGIGRLWVKDEGRQPTASLKDRASAMGVVKATEAGADTITLQNGARVTGGVLGGTGNDSIALNGNV